MSDADESPTPLKLLLELGQESNSALDLDPLLISVLRHVQSAARGEGAAIWLLDDAHARLICTHTVGFETEDHVGRSMPAANLSAADIWSTARAIHSDDIPGLAERPQSLIDASRLGARSFIIAALVTHGERLGAIVVANNQDRASFSEVDRSLVAALAGHAAIAIKNARLREQQQRSNERQRLAEQIGRHLQQTLDIEVLIPLILQAVNTAIKAEAQSLWLLDRETGLLVCRYATGPQADAIKRVAVPVGVGIVGSSVLRQEALIVPDAQRDDLVFRGADQETGFVTRSLICVPMVRQGHAIGALEAVNKLDGGLFTQDDLDLLGNVADSAALSMENAQLYTDLSSSYDSTLDALMSALESRDQETEGHSRRVLEYTVRLARQLGLDGPEIAAIRRGALIHDIGKISIPDAILKKPGPLDPEERRIMRTHPLTGYEILYGIPHLKNDLQIVLSHHERWDGAGYPFGLAGEAIPLAARLFALSDTFDAVTSDRPYRRARSCQSALQVIADEKGRQFDPVAAEAFLAIPPAEWDVIRSGVLAGLTQRRTSRDEQIRRHHAKMVASGRMPEPPGNGQ